MKKYKYIAVLLFALLLVLPALAKKRVKPLSMKELTNPNSTSFAPHPYPKNRPEIIADLKYYAEEYCNPQKVNYVGDIPHTDVILSELFKSPSEYTINEIVKVKNRCAKLPHSYAWLIIIRDRNNEIAMRVSITASGLYGGAEASKDQPENSGSPAYRQRRERLKVFTTEDDVKNILSRYFRQPHQDLKIKRVERIDFLSTLGDFLYPIWEIEMGKGTFYYSKIRGALFSVEKRLPWKIVDRESGKKALKTFEAHANRDKLRDTINDQLIVLKKIENTEKQ